MYDSACLHIWLLCFSISNQSLLPAIFLPIMSCSQLHFLNGKCGYLKPVSLIVLSWPKLLDEALSFLLILLVFLSSLFWCLFTPSNSRCNSLEQYSFFRWHIVTKILYIYNLSVLHSVLLVCLQVLAMNITIWSWLNFLDEVFLFIFDLLFFHLRNVKLTWDLWYPPDPTKWKK